VIILNLINLLLLYCSHLYREIYSVQFAKTKRKSIVFIYLTNSCTMYYKNTLQTH